MHVHVQICDFDMATCAMSKRIVRRVHRTIYSYWCRGYTDSLITIDDAPNIHVTYRSSLVIWELLHKTILKCVEWWLTEPVELVHLCSRSLTHVPPLLASQKQHHKEICKSVTSGRHGVLGCVSVEIRPYTPVPNQRGKVRCYIQCTQ